MLVVGGGEEFLVICPETDLASAVLVADKIRLAIGEIKLCEAQQYSISAGVAQARTSEHISELIERADICLYQAKGTGRNRVCC